MSDFQYPKCKNGYDVGELELFQLYNEDVAQAEFDCKNCESEIIITSHVTGWEFETELNE